MTVDLQLDHTLLFTVEDDVLRGDGRGTHHAAQVGPGVLCTAARGTVDYSTRSPSDGQFTLTDDAEARPPVQTVRWEHGTAHVDCRDCLLLLVQLGER